MRITFLILLLANLVLVLWQTQIKLRNSDAETLPEIPTEHKLLLLSEHQQPAVVDIVEEVAEESEAPAIEPTQPDLGLPDIQIMGTTPLSEELLDAELEPEPEPEPEPEIPQLFCYTMGPIKEIGTAKMISTRLDDIGAPASRRSKVEQEQYGYRVYLKPYATREEAVAEARRLAENGVRDYYIITDDLEKINGISLGLFRKKSGAIRRMAQVRRFDFRPHLEVRYRDTTIYWLDFDHTADVDSEALWRELSEETPELQRLDRDCESSLE